MDSLSKTEKLDFLYQNIKNCDRCELSRTRTRLVFGDGNCASPIVFIGEGPGQMEDLQGKPFVGRSGQLLSEAIFEVFQWTRENYYITNLVKCRPTVDQQMKKDRPPDKTEVEQCHHILMMQMEIIKPDIIVAVGSSAAKYLLQTEKGITSIRGTWSNFQNIPLLPIFHPSYVLRNGGRISSQYRMLVSDLESVKKHLNKEGLS